MAQKKVALIIGYGQSNEQGTGVSPQQGGVAIAPQTIAHNVRHQAVFGPPVVGSVNTSPSVSTASMFQKMAEFLAAKTGWALRYRNNCIGGQSCTDSWVGYNTTAGRLCVPGEAPSAGNTGYDPNGFLLSTSVPSPGFLTSVAAAVADGYEVWTFTAGHQNDVNNSTHTVAEIIAASAHIQNRAKALGASKQFIGITPRYIGSAGEANWNPGGIYQQIRDGVIAAVPGALLGADLSGNLDTKLCALDNQQFIHLNQAGICWAGEQWLNAIAASGALS